MPELRDSWGLEYKLGCRYRTLNIRLSSLVLGLLDHELVGMPRSASTLES